MACETEKNPGGHQPTCYVVAGPNGAGKTTFAMTYLRDLGCPYLINADMISQGLAPLAPQTVQVQAGKLFLGEIRVMVERRSSFAFETTLSGRGHLRLLEKLKREQWHVVLIYLWLPGPEHSERRVQERVRAGGHDIPREAIYRRYPRSLRNLMHDYAPLCSLLMCYDNSGLEPVAIFQQDEQGTRVADVERYEQFMRSCSR